VRDEWNWRYTVMVVLSILFLVVLWLVALSLPRLQSETSQATPMPQASAAGDSQTSRRASCA